MKLFITILQLICGLAIILAVLFQSGKSAGLSGTIGGVADTEVPLDFGCYLLCWADTLSEGTVDISEVSDALSAQILREKQNENWKTAQAQWRAEAEITIDETLIAY